MVTFPEQRLQSSSEFLISVVTAGRGGPNRTLSFGGIPSEKGISWARIPIAAPWKFLGAQLQDIQRVLVELEWWERVWMPLKIISEIGPADPLLSVDGVPVSVLLLDIGHSSVFTGVVFCCR